MKNLLISLSLVATATINFPVWAHHHQLILVMCENPTNRSVRPVEVLVVESDTADVVLRWPWAMVQNAAWDTWVEENIPDWQTHPANIHAAANGLCEPRMGS